MNGELRPSAGTIDAIARVVFQLGVPTVFAGILLYFVIFKVEEHLDSIVKMETARMEQSAVWQRELSELFGEILAEEKSRTVQDKEWRAEQLQTLRAILGHAERKGRLE